MELLLYGLPDMFDQCFDIAAGRPSVGVDDHVRMAVGYLSPPNGEAFQIALFNESSSLVAFRIDEDASDAGVGILAVRLTPVLDLILALPGLTGLRCGIEAKTCLIEDDVAPVGERGVTIAELIEVDLLAMEFAIKGHVVHIVEQVGDTGPMGTAVAMNGPSYGARQPPQQFKAGKAILDGKVDRAIQQETTADAEHLPLDMTSLEVAGDDGKAFDALVADKAVGASPKNGNREIVLVGICQKLSQLLKIRRIGSQIGFPSCVDT